MEGKAFEEKQRGKEMIAPPLCREFIFSVKLNLLYGGEELKKWTGAGGGFSLGKFSKSFTSFYNILQTKQKNYHKHSPPPFW